MTAHLLFPSGPLAVLAIGAHPDDIEIGCGGTLLALHERGDVDVRSLVLTGTKERNIEARAAARLFGSTHEPRLEGLPDTRLPAHWDAVKTALHAFRDDCPEPDVIFAPRPDDAHQDHALVGSLVLTVWRGPIVLQYEIPKWEGDRGQPNIYVPLSESLAAKKISRLTEAFPSQRHRHWWDDEFFCGIMRLRGAESATRYAEAFETAKLTLDIS